MPLEEEFDAAFTAYLGTDVGAFRQIPQFHTGHSDPVPEKVYAPVQVSLCQSSEHFLCLGVVQKHLCISEYHYVVIVVTHVFYR